MISTTYYMERPAPPPTAAPVGAVALGFGHGHTCSSPSAQHRSASANAIANPIDGAVKRGMAGTDWQVGLTTTNRFARRLGRPST